VAIFLAIAIPFALGLLVLRLGDGAWLQSLVPGLTDDLLARTRESAPTAMALLTCITALHVMGLVDDRTSLGPAVKFIVQFGTAGVMVIFFDVRLLTLLGDVPSIIVTTLWIVAITNAINFMDNMDGLAGGVTMIAAALFMVATVLNAQWFIAGTLALVIVPTIDLLRFNFPPGGVFMGDGGTLELGFLLAVLTARTTFYDAADPQFALGTGWYGLFMPIVVLAVPLYDLVTVTILRLRQGRSPLVGDQQHFSHRLVHRGLSKRGAVIMIWGATAVTGISGIALGKLAPWQAALVGVQTILVLVVIALFEHASRHVADPERLRP